MGYYAEKIGGVRLQECYELAPARVKQYLNAEIRFVMERLDRASTVLELGCGYARVALRLAKVAGRVVAIDTAGESLALARQLAGALSQSAFLEMDALHLGFHDDAFDAVVCIQNGICAFSVDQKQLVREALRVTRPGGRALFSSYAERFWSQRLDWFRLQAERGLIGEIDLNATGDGVIVCKDGFRAGAMSPTGFGDLCALLQMDPVLTEVDGSSLFCELVASGAR